MKHNTTGRVMHLQQFAKGLP